jgi:23S rRNA (cytosine1962-C5)-methyltransferase
MKYDAHLTSLPWQDYELIDSGENMKLERYGEVIVARPETQALWKKTKPELWKNVQAEFRFGDKKGAWNVRKELPEPWKVTRGPLSFTARLTSFKHTGIFPEQEPNWVWIKDQVKKLGNPSVLNLFGYTGIATLAAAHPGAKVTHVDASKQSITWARENAELTGIEKDRIRWILDDALAFVKREARRGASYEGIILDPPAFGRGAKGEVWKIEEDLRPLLEVLKTVFSNAPSSFFILNGYAAGYAPRSFAQCVEGVFGEVQGESGELHLKESGSDRIVPAGIYVRFVR